jgi:DNA-binding GntR family transcriptional regulator
MQSEPIPRRLLVDEACTRIRTWILEGGISSDTDLTEPRLAALLGISRTPVREAIGRLAHEGLLQVEKGRGFRVAPVNEAMVREIYPIIGALEAMALRTSGDDPPDPAEMRKVNGQITAPNVSRPRLFELDHEFHRILTANCPNPRLIELLETHRRLARRFDGAAKRGMHKPRESAKEHAAIIDDVARGHLDRAAHRVEQHYLDGIATVIEWLEISAS